MSSMKSVRRIDGLRKIKLETKGDNKPIQDADWLVNTDENSYPNVPEEPDLTKYCSNEILMFPKVPLGEKIKYGLEKTAFNLDILFGSIVYMKWKEESRNTENIAVLMKLNTRIDQLELKVDQLELKVDHLELKVDHLEFKVDQLELKVDQNTAAIAILDAKVENLTIIVNQHTTAITNLTNTVNQHTTAIALLDTKMDFVIKTLISIDNRISDMSETFLKQKL